MISHTDCTDDLQGAQMMETEDSADYDNGMSLSHGMFQLFFVITWLPGAVDGFSPGLLGM